jgi:hypothetical protein
MAKSRITAQKNRSASQLSSAASSQANSRATSRQHSTLTTEEDATATPETTPSTWDRYIVLEFLAEMAGTAGDAFWYAKLIDLLAATDTNLFVFGLTATGLGVGMSIAILASLGTAYCQKKLNEEGLKNLQHYGPTTDFSIQGGYQTLNDNLPAKSANQGITPLQKLALALNVLARGTDVVSGLMLAVMLAFSNLAKTTVFTINMVSLLFGGLCAGANTRSCYHAIKSLNKGPAEALSDATFALAIATNEPSPTKKAKSDFLTKVAVLAEFIGAPADVFYMWKLFALCSNKDTKTMTLSAESVIAGIIAIVLNTAVAFCRKWINQAHQHHSDHTPDSDSMRAITVSKGEKMILGLFLLSCGLEKAAPTIFVAQLADDHLSHNQLIMLNSITLFVGILCSLASLRTGYMSIIALKKLQITDTERAAAIQEAVTPRPSPLPLLSIVGTQQRTEEPTDNTVNTGRSTGKRQTLNPGESGNDISLTQLTPKGAAVS